MTRRLAVCAAACGLLAPLVVSQAKVQAFPMHEARQVAGMFLWDGTASPGNFAIQYGQPVWRPDYDDLIVSDRAGAFRLGKGYWTTLDASVDLEIGGVAVPAGQYFLGMERDGEGAFHLMVLRAKPIMQKNVVPMMTSELDADIRCPMKHSKSEKQTELLTIRVDPQKDDATRATLHVLWGGHQLTAKVAAVLDKNKPPETPRAEVHRAIAHMIELIENNDLTGLVETYAPPAVIDREGGVAGIVADIDDSDAQEMLEVLRIARGLEGSVNASGDVVFRHDDFPKDLRFRKIDGGWRLVD